MSSDALDASCSASASAAAAASQSERIAPCARDDEKQPGGDTTDAGATADGGANAEAFAYVRRDPNTRLDDLIALFYIAAEENSCVQSLLFDRERSNCCECNTNLMIYCRGHKQFLLDRVHDFSNLYR